MTRDEIYKEMREVFGDVPSFFEKMPDSVLEHEWRVFRVLEVDEGPIPAKYVQLIELAASAQAGCEHCVYACEQFARLFGATDEEIERTVHLAKSNAGWVTYLRGMRVPFDEFKRDIDRAVEQVRRQQEGPVEERKAA